ncbi:MAG: hypothetical protein ACP5GW_04515, partial [Caldisericaceae bacterium]
MYKNRIDAGNVLLEEISRRGLRDSLSFLFGIPRGGIEVAFPVAEGLHKEIIPLIVHKIPSSVSDEVAIGAITPDGEFILNDYASDESK